MIKRLFLLFVCSLSFCLNSYSAQPKGKIQITVKGVTFNMIYVAPGTFTMGAKDENEYDKREHPAHKVTLTRGYYICETEVTQELWQAVMGNNPSEHIGMRHPVNYVTWNDCKAFASILSFITGKTFRLPTEAEWEYAAKGGKKSKGYLYSGSNNLDEVAWYVVNSGDEIIEDKTYFLGNKNNNRTHEVKTKKPNELGIYDMSGNVTEWCEDGFSNYDYGNFIDPLGVSNKDSKVKKGGDYDSRSRHCRNTFRVGFETTFCMGSYGFRLIMEE